MDAGLLGELADGGLSGGLAGFHMAAGAGPPVEPMADEQELRALLIEHPRDRRPVRDSPRRWSRRELRVLASPWLGMV